MGRTHVLYLLPAEDDARAVVASRKVGGAVQRNRAKRVLRELLQAVIFKEPERALEITACCASGAGPDAPADGLWIVAVARRAILDCDIHAVKAESLAMLDEFLKGCGKKKASDLDERSTDDTGPLEH